MSKKLFIVVNVDWFFLSHRKEIAVAALNQDYKVTVVAKDTGNRKDIENLGLKMIRLPIDSTGTNIFKELRTFYFLLKLYLEEKPDIVHHVGLKVILWGTIAARLAHVSGIVNAVSGLGVLFSQKHISLLPKGLLFMFRILHYRKHLRVIFQNQDDRNLFENYHIVKPWQVVMIKGSGINLSQYNYVPELERGIINIVFTGRMVREKGVSDVIDAANLLRKEYEGTIHFLLCGGLDKNPQALREGYLQGNSDGKYISWLGHRKDIKEILESAHIVVFPSYYREGIPKSLIEASAIGRPIITCNSAGCREVVIDGYSGYTVPVQSPKSIAEKLKILIEDSCLRKQMGENARILAEQEFSIETVIEKHLEIYKTLLKIS